jgi:hypothetical protein
MRKIYRRSWEEVKIEDIKDGDSFKYEDEDITYTAYGDSYVGPDGEVIVNTLEDLVEVGNGE